MEAKLASGSVIDERYRIVEPLGSGGMGHVYRAEHLTLRRQVAVKVLHHTLAGSEEMRRRFEREAFASARLDHANCATAFDFGRLPDGSDYFVAELLDGVSLQDLLDQDGRLAPLRALHILGHILRGLGHMHARGVVHRDIKPDNVMIIDRDGDPDFGRILDFGIAKLLGQAEADASPEDVGLTSAGTAIGTPAYIAPEQALGQDIDGRADLYAVTVVLFKMLTGRQPFNADTAMQLVMKHATNPPPSLTDAAGRLFSAELEALVARGLAKQPSDRFADAAQYLDALSPVVAAERNAPASVQPHAHASTELAMRTPAPIGSASPLGVAPTTPVPIPGVTPSPISSSQAWADYASDILHQVGGSVPGTAAAQRPWRAAFWRTWRAWGPAQWIAALVAVVGPLVILAVVCNAASAAGFDESLTKLQTGKTCEERREAVAALRGIGDKRAISHLKKARYRMRGGIAGVGDSNTNACLKADAERAIEALSD